MKKYSIIIYFVVGLIMGALSNEFYHIVAIVNTKPKVEVASKVEPDTLPNQEHEIRDDIERRFKVKQRIGYSVTTGALALITQVYKDGYVVKTWADSSKVSREFANKRLLQAEKEREILVDIELNNKSK